MLNKEWVRVYPALGKLDNSAAEFLARSVKIVKAPVGTRIFSYDDPCLNWHLLLEGSVRVHQIAASGREIVICRFYPGKTCIISALGVLADQPYNTEAIAETDITALALPGKLFRQLIGESNEFRQFVFAAYNTEIVSLMSIVDDVAYGRVDSRLAACLLARANEKNIIRGTQEDLAVEVGTAREVISRQLKAFEELGWVSRMRGQVELLKPAALRRAATHLMD